MAAAAAPRPKSPPASPDPCGRHRLQLAVDALHREIGFLEGEISSIEGVHAASRCCKEVDEFVGRNPDPFITIQPEKRGNEQSQQFLKKFRARSCLSYLSWICCCGGGGCPPFRLKMRPAAATSCSCGGAQLRKLCASCCSCCCCCRCRVVCAGCCGGCCAPCPRCSCDCACLRCCSSSCACPTCGGGACCVPRCCLCL
ncbi:hypothetical protein GQ55_9G447100 [Panicum hallii var. hallii]|uniref:G protein gamma domain-containing protein n=1 Tax=Panicum hallii var. hallii TaxID=1504633 RepID=A0A2T7CBL8_9POAL|nr:hypothetical protein GQ55_9G447100 [Panicum hallii var. hallii]